MRKPATYPCFLLLLLPVVQALGQVVNIDREAVADSSMKKWEWTLSGTLSSDKQKRNLLEGNFNTELVRNLRDRTMLLLVVRNDLVLNGADVIQNEGMIHFRFRDRDTRKTSPEFFYQYQWNGAWGMDYRMLLGGNVRRRLTDKAGYDLYAGTGLFREWERWRMSDPVTRGLWRWNNYLKMSAKLSSVVDLSLISFLQFPLGSDVDNPRWYMEANAFLNAGKHVSLVLHWDHIHDRATLLPIDPFFYSFSTGIQINY